MRIPGLEKNTSVAFHSNKLVVVSRHQVTLISLTRSLNIEHLPRLTYKEKFCGVLLSEDRIYYLNSVPDGCYLINNKYKIVWRSHYFDNYECSFAFRSVS